MDTLPLVAPMFKLGLVEAKWLLAIWFVRTIKLPIGGSVKVLFNTFTDPPI